MASSEVHKVADGFDEPPLPSTAHCACGSIYGSPVSIQLAAQHRLTEAIWALLADSTLSVL
jgi:hypothetical protein